MAGIDIDIAAEFPGLANGPYLDTAARGLLPRSAHAAIVARGARSEHGAQLVARMPDHELWMAFVRDPEGNLIGLMEERR